MNVHERRERLRSILAGDEFVRPASVYDALTARAAEELGFEMMVMGGSPTLLTVLGATGRVLLTLSEFAEQARRITRAASLPLLADADHGYGNALNVMRCVNELESAGVSALSIEDTVLPHTFGASEAAFLSIEEGAGKMRAAVAARTDPSLVILARTGAIRGEGLDGAILRAQAYGATGVDGLFLSGLQTRAELEALRAVSSLPFVMGAGIGRELGDAAYLAAQGVYIGGWNHRPIKAATVAVYEALRGLRQEAIAGKLPPALGPDELMDVLSRKRDYEQNVERYLRE